MSKGAGGYITDLVYPDHFHRETSPAWIAGAVAAIGQQAPRIERPFRYLDLGCGTGHGTALLAAANPNGSFVGVDINPDHIERGRALGAGLPNLAFIEARFDALAMRADALEKPFDFIVLHGIYSWLSAENRAAVHRLIDRWLAPGGIVYLHYSTHPGQSAFAGARAMLGRIARATPDDSAAGLANGVAYLRALAESAAGYMREYPQLAGFLRQRGEEPAYLAHDLLAPDWTALHVGDVIDEMEGLDGAFIGSATVLENVDALTVPGSALPLLRWTGDVKTRETAGDLARNQSLRRDLYRRGLAGLAPDAYHAQLASLRYAALPGLRSGGDVVVATRIGPASVDAGMVDPVRSRLRAGAASFAELIRAHPSAPAPGMLLQALLVLADAGEAHVARAGGTDGAAAHQLNARLAGRGGQEGWLAAPAIGSAVRAGALELTMAACLLRKPELRAAALADAIQAQIVDAGREAIARHERETLPRWRELGVLPG